MAMVCFTTPHERVHGQLAWLMVGGNADLDVSVWRQILRCNGTIDVFVLGCIYTPSTARRSIQYSTVPPPLKRVCTTLVRPLLDF
jgi:hypothetical protein